MGLLDSFFGSPEQTQALGLLGAQLMAGNAPGGFQAATGFLAEAPRRAMQSKLLEAQLAETLAQADERKLKLAAMQRQQDILGRYFGNGAPSQPATPGQLGSGSFGAVSPAAGQPAIPPAQSGGRLARMSADDLAMLKLNGLDISEAWKAANIPTQIRANSYAILPGREPQYMSDPTKGMDYRDGRITGIPGYMNFLTQSALATKGPEALLGAAGRMNLRPNNDGTQSPISELSENPTLQSLIGQISGGALGAPTAAPQAAPQPAPRSSAPLPTSPAGAPRIAPTEQKARDAESIRMIVAELSNPNLPADQRAGLEREVQRLAASQSQPGFPTPTLKISPNAQGRGYGKTTQQQIDEEVAKVRALDAAKSPEGYERLPDGTLRGIPGGPADLKREEKSDKAIKRKAAIDLAAKTVVQDMNRGILTLEKNMDGLVTTAAGPLAMVMRNIPATDAHTLEKFNESVKSNISIDRLQAMRESSPTGGALGQIPVQQQKYLMQLLGSLETEQKPRILLDNMQRIFNIYNDIIHGEGNGPKRYTLSFDDDGNPLRANVGSAFSDAAKEQRYQEWRRSQNK